MKFLEIVRKLQKENKGYVILIRCGIFFATIGKDAVFMNKQFGSTPVCIQENLCKCGIPVNTFEKYIPKLRKSGYSYIIYDYDKSGEYKEVGRIEGKMIEETEEHLECETCWQKTNSTMRTLDASLKLIEDLIKETNERFKN